MLDFIKNNKIIVGAVTAMVLMIIVIILLFVSSGNSTSESDGVETFPTNEAERYFATSSEEVFLFGTSSERFVPDGTEGAVVPNFRAVTRIPVAGATIYEKRSSSSTAEYIRFTSRINGHIIDTPLATLGEESTVSNKTILRIGNSIWSSNGSTTLSRYFEIGGTQIYSYLSFTTLGTTTEEGLPAPYVFDGRPMTETIQDAALSPSGDEFFYLVSTSEGTTGYLENVKSGARKLVWSSLLRSLSVSWTSQNTILIYSNPSSSAEGAVWIVNPHLNATAVVLAKNLALAAKSNPEGTKILYSLQETKNSIFSLRILDVTTGKSTHLPVATMVEKCAWGPGSSKYIYCALPRSEMSGSMLEDWYMGVLNTDDVLWRIDTATGVIKRLLDPFEETKERFDIVNIVVSPQEEFVVFKTRVNSTLWSLRLPEKVTVDTMSEEKGESL